MRDVDTQVTEFLTTKELAELLRIKERRVYELAASGEIPCLRATGKLLFPRAAVDAWLAHAGSVPSPGVAVRRPNVFLGSHDPLLDWALRESRCGLACLFDGSLDGLDRFSRGEGLAAGLHLYMADEEDWNIGVVRREFGSDPIILVEFAWRERGLIIAQGRGDAIRGLEDLRGRRVAPRQSGAGSQVLLDYLLRKTGILPVELKLTEPVRTETDAACAVLEGKADAAFGLSGLAARSGLGFVPVIRERFDLLVDRRSWFEQPMQRFLEFCRSDAFASRANELGGYDVSGFGRVLFNGV